MPYIAYKAPYRTFYYVLVPQTWSNRQDIVFKISLSTLIAKGCDKSEAKKNPFPVISGKRKNKPIKEDVSPSPHFGNSATISSLTCHGLRMPGTHARAFWVLDD